MPHGSIAVSVIVRAQHWFIFSFNKREQTALRQTLSPPRPRFGLKVSMQVPVTVFGDAISVSRRTSPPKCFENCGDIYLLPDVAAQNSGQVPNRLQGSHSSSLETLHQTGGSLLLPGAAGPIPGQAPTEIPRVRSSLEPEVTKNGGTLLLPGAAVF